MDQPMPVDLDGEAREVGRTRLVDKHAQYPQYRRNHVQRRNDALCNHPFSLPAFQAIGGGQPWSKL